MWVRSSRLKSRRGQPRVFLRGPTPFALLWGRRKNLSYAQTPRRAVTRQTQHLTTRSPFVVTDGPEAHPCDGYKPDVNHRNPPHLLVTLSHRIGEVSMKNFLKVVLLFVIIIGIFILAGLVIWNLLDRTNGSLVSSGEKREYLLYVPESYDPTSAQNVPLVINIHGFSQWPANQANVSQWNQLADEEGFIVVYPSGLGIPKRWRVTRTAEEPTAVDIELQYYRDLIDKLSKEYAIDPERIYASGLSNGGGMSLRLACSLSDRVAAIGGVAGAYLVDLEECPGGVPAIFFHGQADKIVPYEGGPSERFPIDFPYIPTFVEDYSQLNNCDPNETVFLDKDHVTGVRYEGCDPGADVVFYTISDGGHTWPGGNDLPERITGKTTHEINATRLMWEFFLEQTENR